jgi:hypothetical protein
VLENDLEITSRFMKEGFSQAFVAIFFGLFTPTNAQPFEVKRAGAVYHPETVLDPATLLFPGNFSDTESGRYVLVEGYIDYVATAWPETMAITTLKCRRRTSSIRKIPKTASFAKLTRSPSLRALRF